MRALVAILSAGLLAGCTLVPEALDDPTADLAPGRPEAVRLSGVPFHPQKGFHCGPASLASLLQWTGVEVTPEQLEGRFFGEPADLRPDLMATVRGFGRFAYPVTGAEALRAEIAAGHPVLILENLGVAKEPLWNCPVAVGFADGGARILVHGGDDPDKVLSRGLLERLWSDTDQWAMVVLRPGDLPATAQAETMVAAADGLQKVGRYWEAVMAYDAILSQWPGDASALMGLGASLYMLGDTTGAAQAYNAAMAAGAPSGARVALAVVQAEMAKTKPVARTAALPKVGSGPN
jgi:hypothetical protein